MLQAEISKTGDIQNLRAVSGHPMLAPAAIEAVKQWRYKPYILNGEPVEVETTDYGQLYFVRRLDVRLDNNFDATACRSVFAVIKIIARQVPRRRSQLMFVANLATHSLIHVSTVATWLHQEAARSVGIRSRCGSKWDGSQESSSSFSSSCPAGLSA